MPDFTAQQRKAHYQQQMRAQKPVVDESPDDAKVRIAELESKVKELRAANAVAGTGELSALEDALDASRQDASASATQVGQLKNEIAQNQHELEALRKSLEEKNTEAITLRASAETKVSLLEKDVKKLVGQVKESASQASKIASHKADMKSLRAKLATAEAVAKKAVSKDGAKVIAHTSDGGNTYMHIPDVAWDGSEFDVLLTQKEWDRATKRATKMLDD